MDLGDVLIDLFSHLMLLLGRRGDLHALITDRIDRITNLFETARANWICATLLLDISTRRVLNNQDGWCRSATRGAAR
jgi:hypothetical protein